jgi:hypothetical protein
VRAQTEEWVPVGGQRFPGDRRMMRRAPTARGRAGVPQPSVQVPPARRTPLDDRVSPTTTRTPLDQQRGANYDAETAFIDVSKNGKFLETMHSERRFYHASEQLTSEVAIRPRLNEDVYLVFAGYSTDGQTPVIQAYINPLVNWIWMGGFMLVFGTLIALIPSKVKRIHPKMRIVGTAKKEEDAVLAQS